MARAIAPTHYVSPGIYVRDISDGKVRAVKGQSYMLRSNEELWEKDLPPAVEELIAREMEADAATLLTAKARHSPVLSSPILLPLHSTCFLYIHSSLHSSLLTPLLTSLLTSLLTPLLTPLLTSLLTPLTLLLTPHLTLSSVVSSHLLTSN